MRFPLAFLEGLNSGTLLFLGIIALLLFGEKLPEVARTWGKKFVDLKRNVDNLQSQIRNAALLGRARLVVADQLDFLRHLHHLDPRAAPSARRARGRSRGGHRPEVRPAAQRGMKDSSIEPRVFGELLQVQRLGQQRAAHLVRDLRPEVHFVVEHELGRGGDRQPCALLQFAL